MIKDIIKINKLKKESKNHNAQAFIELGKIYFEKKKYKDAVTYFLDASKADNGEAFYYLGLIYLDNYLNNEDHLNLAYSYFQKANELGYVKALASLANMTYKGLGTEKNNELALSYLIKYAELSKSCKAIIKLGEIYFYGLDDIKVNLSYALRCLEYASETYDDPIALHDLGMLYEKLGNYIEAKGCYLKATNRYEYPMSYYNLAVMNYYGLGIVQSYTKALYYFKKAAELGVIKANSQIANIYINGLGDYVELDKGYKYAKIAADKLDPYGLYLLASLYEKGSYVKKDEKLAIQYYKKSASYNFDLALDKLKSLDLKA